MEEKQFPDRKNEKSYFSPTLVMIYSKETLLTIKPVTSCKTKVGRARRGRASLASIGPIKTRPINFNNQTLQRILIFNIFSNFTIEFQYSFQARVMLLPRKASSRRSPAHSPTRREDTTGLKVKQKRLTKQVSLGNRQCTKMLS